MKYLVTGGCGFIGSHIAEQILCREHDAQVVILDNLSTGNLANIAAFRGRTELMIGDIRDPDLLNQAMSGVHYVFHEAAMVSVFESVENPRANHETNLTGTLNVLEAARGAGVRRVVFAASAAAYGNNPELPKTEDMVPEPESPYAMAKTAGEYYMALYAGLYGLETVSLRYFNVFGPRQDPSSMYSGVISKFVDVLKKGDRPTVFGDGGQTRDFVFVKDIVQANMLASTCSRVGAGEVINVGTGTSTSLLQLLAALERIFAHPVEPRFEPARPGDVRHSVADIAKAGALLGYSPATSLEAGLRALVGDLEEIS